MAYVELVARADRAYGVHGDFVPHVKDWWLIASDTSATGCIMGRSLHIVGGCVGEKTSF